MYIKNEKAFTVKLKGENGTHQGFTAAHNNLDER